MITALTKLEETFKLKNRVGKGFTTNDLIASMVNFRMVIEKNNLQEKYKYLNLYCNWTVHTKLSSSITGYRLLEEITDSFIENFNYTGVKWVAPATVEILSLHNLHLDILNFSSAFKIDLLIFIDENFWWNFTHLLLFNLLDRPIQFPENILNYKKSKAKDIYDSIHLKATSTGYIRAGVKEICFTLHEDSIYYQITALDGVRFIGRMMLVTQKMIDENNKQFENGSILKKIRK